MTEITQVDVKPATVCGMRKTGMYQMIPEMLMQIHSFISDRGLTITGPPMFLCHEKSVTEVMKAAEAGTADVEVAFPVIEKDSGSDEILCYDIPGGKMIRAIHNGPYQEMEGTYKEIFDWLLSNKMEITGPIREIYLNDPNTVSPEETITEILIPV